MNKKREGENAAALLHVQNIHVSELKEYENNPRKNDRAVSAVAESIKQFGFKVPIVIDSDKVIVAGHTRLKAARELGLETVPCIIADDLTPEQVKAFRLADNKTAELAEWDFETLETELAELAEDFDMSAFGFDAFEDDGGEVEEDEAPAVDEEEEPTVQLGDIWQLGEHRLMCGDSTDESNIKKLMNGTKADLIVTDPPYNVAYEGKTKDKLTIQNDNKSAREFYTFLYDSFEKQAAAIKEGGAVYVCFADMESINFLASFQAAGFYLSQILIWNKSAMCIGRSDYQWKHEPIMYGWKKGAAHYFTDSRVETTVIEDKPNINKMSKDELKEYVKELLKREPASTVIEEDKPSRSEDHPTMKPVKLIAYLIRNSSRKGESVLDVFGGSGTTLIACEQTGRRCYTMELDPRYCDVIIKRYEQLTGKAAVKIN